MKRAEGQDYKCYSFVCLRGLLVLYAFVSKLLYNLFSGDRVKQ